jgi:glycosyltransferase involved in cell wall biosynthesis
MMPSMPGNGARPLVSVVLPTHNRPALLSEAVHSVRAQTLQDWELIVVDDGSQPSVDVGRWPIEPQRLRLLRNSTPVGGAASKSLGTMHARGDFIAYLDDDDLFAPTLLARATACFRADPALEVLFIGVRWFGQRAAESIREQAESMQRVVRITAPNAPDAEVWTFDDSLFEALLQAIPMDFQRVVVRRSALHRIGVYRRDCLMWDCDWALRAALVARCALLRPGLYEQRADGQEIFSRPRRERAQLESVLEITLRLRDKPPPRTPERARELLRAAASRHAGSLAYFHALHGPLSSSLSAWWRCVRLRPDLANLKVPLTALAHAARRRLRHEPVTSR